jgi:hypothetical protein
MARCIQAHRFTSAFQSLPESQGGPGRHKCAACAYGKGYQDGFQLKENLVLDLHTLPESQAGSVRHKSPHAAYALGYLDGVTAHYGKT